MLCFKMVTARLSINMLAVDVKSTSQDVIK